MRRILQEFVCRRQLFFSAKADESGSETLAESYEILEEIPVEKKQMAFLLGIVPEFGYFSDKIGNPCKVAQMSRVNYNVKEGRRKKTVWCNCIFPLIILMVCKCHTLISNVVCMVKDLKSHVGRYENEFS